MTETRELKMTGSASGLLLSAANHFDSGDTDLLLMDIAGWDDVTNKSSTTAPKGIGRGSYLISSHTAERVLSVIVQVEKETTDIRTLKRALVKVMLDDEPVTLEVTVEDDNGLTTTVETMTGKVEGVAGPQNGGSVLLTLTVKCLNPDKTTTITTTDPETGTTTATTLTGL